MLKQVLKIYSISDPQIASAHGDERNCGCPPLPHEECRIRILGLRGVDGQPRTQDGLPGWIPTPQAALLEGLQAHRILDKGFMPPYE